MKCVNFDCDNEIDMSNMTICSNCYEEYYLRSSEEE